MRNKKREILIFPFASKTLLTKRPFCLASKKRTERTVVRRDSFWTKRKRGRLRRVTAIKIVRGKKKSDKRRQTKRRVCAVAMRENNERKKGVKQERERKKKKRVDLGVGRIMGIGNGDERVDRQVPQTVTVIVGRVAMRAVV